MTDLRLTGLVTTAVGIFLVFLGTALWNDAQTGRLGAVVGGVCITLGTACAVSGVWALSGGLN